MNYNLMTFSISNYSWNTPKEEAKEAMQKDIANFLAILFKNNQIAVVYEEQSGIVTIEYGHNEKTEPWGCPSPHWITDDEYWTVKEG